MSNETPEKKGGRDPWTGRNNKSGPPDLDAFFKKIFQKIMQSSKETPFKRPMPPALTKAKYGLAIIFAIFIWMVSGFFIVQPAERAIVLRFGRYINTLPPGPHWIPSLIERKIIVNEDKVRTYSYESDMLTKDETIVSVAISVLYRVGSPKDYLFNVVSAEDSLQQATASALRQVIGHNTLDSIVTYGRSEVRAQVEDQLKKILSIYQPGIVITDVVMQPARAPDQVKEAFDDAIKAQEDEQRLINQAQAYAMKIVPLAEGDAKRKLADANAYKEKVVLQATGEANRFSALLYEYKKAPAVTRERLYLQAMEKLYANTQKIVLDANQSYPLINVPVNQWMQNIKDNALESPENSESNNLHTTMTSATPQNITAASRLGEDHPPFERHRPLNREERE